MKLKRTLLRMMVRGYALMCSYITVNQELRLIMQQEKVILADKDISSDGEIGEGLLEETVETQEYVLNLNTGKFHLPTCPSVDDIKKGYFKKIRKMLYAAEKK